MNHCLQQPMAQNESNREVFGNWKSSSAMATGMESNYGCFDCNICLEVVQDPVVTFCGHLYCWPCIYRWFQSQKASSEDPEHQPQCPVCKAEVSQSTLIPLYGRGQVWKQSDCKGTQVGLIIPQRPHGPGFGVHTMIAATPSTSHHSQQLQYRGSYPNHQQVHPYYSMGDHSQTPAFGFAGTTTFHPMIGMFGEMIYARIFGNSQTALYTYPNTYSVATASSARVRRHEMQADRSLSRVSFFLCCCIVLCLLLF